MKTSAVNHIHSIDSIMPQPKIELSLEEFEEINSNELDCIYAENGYIYELDFDPEAMTERIWNNKEKYSKQYKALKWENFNNL